MTPKKRALMLVGSPKKSGSASESMLDYLAEKLEEDGVATGKVHLLKSLKSEESRMELLESVDGSDIIALAFPLYVNGLPSHVIRALQLVEDRRKADKKPGELRMLAICNSGFPQSRQSINAVEMCHIFASRAGLKWLGGLTLGAGMMVSEKRLQDMPRRAGDVMRAMDMVAASVAAGGEVPPEAVDMMTKRAIPNWVYTSFIGTMWKRMARKNGVKGDLKDRPYED